MYHAAKALLTLSLALATVGCAAAAPTAPGELAMPPGMKHDTHRSSPLAPGEATEHTVDAEGHPEGVEVDPTTGAAHDPAMGEMPNMPGHGTTTSGERDINAPPTSYRLEVIPILRNHCASCHTTGGAGAGALTMFNAENEPEFANIKENIGRMLLEIQSGRMPKGKPNSLSKAEFDVLDTWGAAEMPDN